MGTFAFQNTELINNLPKLSERDIAVIEGKLGNPCRDADLHLIPSWLRLRLPRL